MEGGLIPALSLSLGERKPRNLVIVNMFSKEMQYFPAAGTFSFHGFTYLLERQVVPHASFYLLVDRGPDKPAQTASIPDRSLFSLPVK